jgi:outer membrane protein assembly factor BamB
MTTSHTFANGGSAGGVQPIFSANGPDATATNAIAWALDVTGGNDVLYAFNANTLAQLYTSSANSSDQGPLSIKFTLPIVANGRVYVAGQGLVVAYGLLTK